MITQPIMDQLITKFVQDVVKYCKNKKYISEVCPCNLYDSFFNMLSAQTVNSCDNYELECKLTNLANGYDYSVDDVNIPCNQQLTVTITNPTTSTNNSLVLKNNIDGSAYPVFTLTENSTRQNASINLVKNTNGVLTNTVINGGCYSGTCDPALQASASFTVTDYSASLSEDSYVAQLTLYETDNTGQLINQPLNLNVNPATSPYYSGVGLTNLTLSDVTFSNSNWEANMKTLIDNICIYRYGSAAHHSIAFTKILVNGEFERIAAIQTIHHKPSSNVIGFNKLTATIKVYNPTTDSYTNLSNTGTISTTPDRFYYNSTVATACGNLTPTIANQNVKMKVSGSSNFYNLVLTSTIGDTALALSGTVINLCSTNKLTASYNASFVSSVSWKNPANTIISTTNTCDIGANGVYTFTATLTNGCVITKTYTYPAPIDEYLEIQ